MPLSAEHSGACIELGFSALAIADRVGHEVVDITYRYAHLFPTKRQDIPAFPPIGLNPLS